MAFDKERDVCNAERVKVASLEESLGMEREKLQEDINEKLQIITDLSKQLEVHQKNFDALKGELSQVKSIFVSDGKKWIKKRPVWDTWISAIN